jgi:outer membrane murein-binding lipoprotein Lpp
VTERDPPGPAAPIPRVATRDRDVHVPKHATPPQGYPVFVGEEVTGAYEGDELREIRSRRPTDKRIERLEDKHDELRSDVREIRDDQKVIAGHVGDLRAEVSGISGQLEVLPKFMAAIEKAADRANERDDVTFTSKVEVHKAQAIGIVKATLSRYELAVQSAKIVAVVVPLLAAAFAAGRC